MADNVHRKSHNKHLSDINTTATTPTTTNREKKFSNNPTVVHRTTSETIRIGPETDVKLHQFSSNNVSLLSGGNTGSNIAQPSSLSTSNQCRKKTSSFQITSVTDGCRMSNDAGEDSNDDLDESHTEDNSVEHSRITDIDIETPSYSEDTFSKEDVFFNTSNAALGTAPVIPTSSQYGLAIVPSEGNNVNNSVNDNNINTLDISSVTDNNIINLLSSNAKQDTDIREVHSHRNERFKVVKIESTEPFKRGRWTCMDYLDHTSVNQPTAINSIKVSGPNEVCISYGFTDHVNDGVKQTQNPQVDNDKSNNVVDSNGPIPHQDIIQGQNTAGGASYPIAQQNQQAQLQQQQPNSSQLNNQYFQPSQQQQISQQGGGGGAQGATLPSNLQPTHATNLGPQSMPQGSIPIITQPNNNGVVNNQQNITHSKDDNYVTVTPQNQNQQQQQSLTTQNVCQSNVNHPASASSPATQNQSNIIVGNVPPHHQQQQQQQQQQNLSNQVTESMPGMQSVQTIHTVPQVSIGAQQQNTTNIHGAVAPGIPQGQIPQSSPGSCQNVITGIQQSGTGVTFHHSDNEQDPTTGIVAAAIAASQSADATLLESLAEVTQSNDEHHALEDNESMSGTSAVAIDNKIEQAMDLVKSHLMFAVREEVEVLKEKIAELMDRINQLEAENSILKSHATPEILSQLSSQSTSNKLPQQQQQQQQQQQNNVANTGGNSGQ